MNAEGLFTEIPTSLKRLVRLVMRGFYSVEHAIVMDMLIRNPCMKEDDLSELLQFEKKQLRAVISQVKNDRFVNARLRIETGSDGRATRQYYYYINYKVFVNVVKYKLDQMRRKIETEERDSTSRASFKCTSCEKTFTDLEADHLCDFRTGEFRCSFCNSPVDEDESALPKTNSRLLLAKFNEEVQPLYTLLHEVDDIKLAPELLDPKPTDISNIKKDASGQKNRQNISGDHSAWSGDSTRHANYNLVGDQSIIVDVTNVNTSPSVKEKKEQPIWMLQSTVKSETETGDYGTTTSEIENKANSTAQDAYGSSNHNQDDIMEALLAHERKASEPAPVIPGQASNEDSSSESEDSFKASQALQESNVEEMESEGDDDILFVQVGGLRVPLNEITPEHVSRMSQAEKDNYCRLTQDLYASVYE